MKAKLLFPFQFFIIFFISPCLLANEAFLRQEMVEDLHFIKKNFQIKYVPAEWKWLHLGWDLNQQFANAEAEIHQLSSPVLKDYHKVLNKLFTSVADYHVTVSFHSTERASLPFHVHGAEGRYFITWIDEERLPGAFSDWAVGDEVIAFDGQDIEKAIYHLRKSAYDRLNEKTDQRIAERALTWRSGRFAEDVPQGEVEIVLQHKKTAQQRSYLLTWDYRPEQIKENPLPALTSRALPLKQPFFQRPYYKKMMMTPLYAQFKQGERHTGEDIHNLGARHSFVPLLGSVIWQSDLDCPFYAYICETPHRQRIGYVRIATYEGGDEEIAEFEQMIDFFLPRTQALVIDQVNNPGGSVFYKYGLLTFLTDKPLELPKYKIALTQEEVMEAFKALEALKKITSEEEALEVCGPSLYGYPVSLELVHSSIQYFQFILDEWEMGKYITSPVHLIVKAILPNSRVTYNKPIIVLINESDFSCADNFPCILQDNQRATIFGARTAGAGGTVVGEGHPNRLGVAGYSYTNSLLERHLDGTLIENLGVTPDITYELTAEDFRNGYKGYRVALQQVIDPILKEAHPNDRPLFTENQDLRRFKLSR
nr:protease-like activity factor CPAF [Parachlamydia sp. AcF125]